MRRDSSTLFDDDHGAIGRAVRAGDRIFGIALFTWVDLTVTTPGFDATGRAAAVAADEVAVVALLAALLDAVAAHGFQRTCGRAAITAHVVAIVALLGAFGRAVAAILPTAGRAAAV